MALRELGHRVGVVFVYQSDVWRGSIFSDAWRVGRKEYFDDCGVLTYITYGLNIPKLSKYLGWLSTRKLVKDYIKQNGKPDIIHSHFSFWSGWVAQRISMEFQIPYVITEHSSAFAFNLYKKGKFLNIKDSFLKANALISVSSSLADSIQRVLNQDLNFKIIPNMVDTSFFVPDEKRKSEKKVSFFALGNLRSSKGYDFLIESFHKAFQKNKSIELKIGGEGPEREKLESLIQEYGLDSSVKLLGGCKRDDVLEQMQKADFFVHPSDYETFGVVLIEAMSCGLPVIYTKGSGPEEFIPTSCGRAIDKRNINQLAEAIIEFSDSKVEFNREEIREHIIKRFSSESIAKELTNLYQKVLNKDG
jgi:glycosyltransferase involved in cell wall biosynthesis